MKTSPGAGQRPTKGLGFVSRLGRHIKSEWRYVIVSSIILFGATITRLYSIADTPVWFDEAVYALNSRGSFVELIAQTRSANSSPLVLPLILWLFQEYSDSEFFMRLPSALAGIGVIFGTLLLPKVGVPRIVSLATAVVLAASSSQIRYSQEVREYELGVLVVVSLIYFVLQSHLARSERARNHGLLGLTVSLAIAPWVSYGTVVAGISVLGGLIIVSYLSTGLSAVIKLAYRPVFVFGVSALGSFLLIARYQVYVLEAAHLGALYPPSGSIPEQLSWLIAASAGFFVFLTGWAPVGFTFAVAIGLVAVILLGQIMKAKSDLSAERIQGFAIIYIALTILFAVLVVASFAGAYPYGGSRQLLFAAPLLVLAAVWSLHHLITKASEIWSGALLVGLLAILLNTTGPSVYSERDEIDIQITYNNALEIAAKEGISESQVWIDNRAWQMVAFYELNRELNIASLLSSDSIRRLMDAESIDAVVVVYTRTELDQLDDISEELTRAGYLVEEEKMVSSGSLLVRAPSL